MENLLSVMATAVSERPKSPHHQSWITTHVLKTQYHETFMHENKTPLSTAGVIKQPMHDAASTFMRSRVGGHCRLNDLDGGQSGSRIGSNQGSILNNGVYFYSAVSAMQY